MAARRKSPESKSPYHHGDLRRALIDASLELISTEGFSALTLREVARRAGVTHAAPYRHFADKESLLVAVADEGFRAMAAQMREKMLPDSGPLERLISCGTAYVLFAVRHPSHFRVMFGPHFSKPPEQLGGSGEEDNAFELLMQTLVEGQRAGVLREEDPQTLALAAWSMVHGLASLLVERVLEQTGRDAEELARLQARLLIEGLRRAPPER